LILTGKNIDVLVPFLKRLDNTLYAFIAIIG